MRRNRDDVARSIYRSRICTHGADSACGQLSHGEEFVDVDVKWTGLRGNGVFGKSTLLWFFLYYGKLYNRVTCFVFTDVVEKAGTHLLLYGAYNMCASCYCDRFHGTGAATSSLCARSCGC